jgi:hypothetical protein
MKTEGTVAGKVDNSCLIREFSVFSRKKITGRERLEVKLGQAAVRGAGGGKTKGA